jgi:putative acetyltransferase
MTDITIEEDDPSRPQARSLLTEHLQDMHATSPPDSVHALDVDELSAPETTFWTATRGDALLGCVALQELSACEGELKSMRTATAFRAQGVGTGLLRYVISVAQGRGYSKLSLETGTDDYFAAARSLYAAHGFLTCPPFGTYHPDPHSTFMALAINVGAEFASSQDVCGDGPLPSPHTSITSGDFHRPHAESPR